MQSVEAEAYASLGIVPTLEGELLTLTFTTGQRELWGLPPTQDVDQLKPWAELIRFGARLYVKLPEVES